MTRERGIGVALPLDDEHRMLVGDVTSALKRAAKAEPGDRVDIVRYEALSSQLEEWAFSQAEDEQALAFALPLDDSVPGLYVDQDGSVPRWVPEQDHAAVSSLLARGGGLVTVRFPLEPGATARSETKKSPPPFADVWKAPPRVRGSQAVEMRFAYQLEEALRDEQNPRPFVPSGVSNVILTNKLREFVGRSGTRVDVPAEYKDGSRAKHLFPLRSLKFLPAPRGPFDLTVKFALLSIRHTDMDALVDGAWLRNIQISQQRAAAETDDLVYEISRDQLAELSRGGRRAMIEMYQTGLQPAVVGFYRALVDHLLESPGSITVRPMYYQEMPPPRTNQNQRGGRNGQGQRPGRQRPETVVSTSSPFQPGKEWATAPDDRR